MRTCCVRLYKSLVQSISFNFLVSTGLKLKFIKIYNMYYIDQLQENTYCIALDSSLFNCQKKIVHLKNKTLFFFNTNIQIRYYLKKKQQTTILHYSYIICIYRLSTSIKIIYAIFICTYIYIFIFYRKHTTLKTAYQTEKKKVNVSLLDISNKYS